MGLPFRLRALAPAPTYSSSRTGTAPAESFLGCSTGSLTPFPSIFQANIRSLMNELQ